MEARKGNVIINVDAEMDDGEKQLVEDCALIIDEVISTRRLEFKLVCGSAFKTVLGFIGAMMEEGK